MAVVSRGVRELRIRSGSGMAIRALLSSANDPHHAAFTEDWTTMTVQTLNREMYSEAEAARLLGISQSSLNYWLEGGVRRGKTYRPVIRVEARGGRAPVSWAEFVEAGLLRSYRRSQVPMRELRAFIDLQRKRYDLPYPLAHRQPFIGDRHLLFADQETAQLAPDYALVTDLHGQYLLAAPAEDFLHRVTWDGDLAAGWRPSGDPASPVRIDPDVRFGRPAIKGISTEVIREHRQAGESDDEIADAFDMTPDDITWALAYELGTATTQTAA